MNQVDQNINKDMIESDLIDVETFDFSDDQTWLYVAPGDSGQRIDIIEWNLSLDWPIYEDSEYENLEKTLNSLLDSILKNDNVALPDKQKFDSRTYVKPKKRVQRPSIQSIVEVTSNPPSITAALPFHQPANQPANKYLTYNKYSSPLGPISPMIRLKTFNVDMNTDNSNIAKDFTTKRKSIVQDDDPQLEDLDVPSDPGKPEYMPSKPINIDLSQPAHNLHNTFNKGFINVLNERGSLNMYQSGESLMRMSPPSLVSSYLMESSGTFNAESLDSRKSLPSYRDSGPPTSGKDSLEPMVTSMTLSILDEKDMSTSFLSQTTHPDDESLIDSLPPSLVNSVNSSYIVSTSKPKTEGTDSNIFSSATFTHLEQSEKLLSARPRCNIFNTFTKRDSGIRNTESYTKAREEACQIDTVKILNENSDKKDSPKMSKSNEMSETITLHYSNNKFKSNDAEKENLDETFKTDDAFYKEMGIQKVTNLGKNSLNVTMDKQELNEIQQARHKLSLARKTLPSEPDKPLPNQVDNSAIKTIQLPNQIITVPKKSMENVSELLARRRLVNHDKKEEEITKDTPKRNATFRKPSPKATAMDTTVVYLKTDEKQMIDINSATLNLIDTGDKSEQEEWGSQERAMVGSSESTDTGTFSSSSPPDSVPDTTINGNEHHQIASTPVVPLRKGPKSELLNVHKNISPIYNVINDTSYTFTKAPTTGMEHTYDVHNATVIHKATAENRVRDIPTLKSSPEKSIAQTLKSPNRISADSVLRTAMAPATNLPRKTNLPTSKLRQFSSHRELNRIPGVNPSGMQAPRTLVGRTMVRRGVYASNPALSPTAPSAPTVPATSHPTHHTHLTHPAKPMRRESYTIAVDQNLEDKDKQTQKPSVPALVRQGTETLRRERPQSQLVAPKDLRGLSSQIGSSGLPVCMRNHHMPPPTTRPYSIAGATQLKVSRPVSVPVQRPVAATPSAPRPVTAADSRLSALPRPSRLPAPRRGLRPPSVYSSAPATEYDNY